MKQKENLSTMTVHELVDWLDKQYPHRCIRETESTADAHRRAGKRDVVDTLINRLQREENASHPQISL